MTNVDLAWFLWVACLWFAVYLQLSILCCLWMYFGLEFTSVPKVLFNFPLRLVSIRPLYIFLLIHKREEREIGRMSLILVNDPSLQLKISSLKFKRFALSFRGLERQLRYLGFSNHWNDCCFSQLISPVRRRLCRYVST